MQNLPNQTISLLSHFSECVNFFYSSCSFADKMQYQFFNDELTILNDWERSDIGWQLWWWLQVTSQNIYIKYSQIYIERRFAPKMQITNSKLLFAQLLFFCNGEQLCLFVFSYNMIFMFCTHNDETTMRSIICDIIHC